MLDQLVSLRDSKLRSRDQVLAVYLFWLKTGMNQQVIMAYFGIDSQQEISRYCKQARKSMEKDFLPKFIAAQHKSREEWISHN